jgi:hypothetical protein
VLTWNRTGTLVNPASVGGRRVGKRGRGMGSRQDMTVNQRRCGTQTKSAFSPQCGADQRRNSLLTHNTCRRDGGRPSLGPCLL